MKKGRESGQLANRCVSVHGVQLLQLNCLLNDERGARSSNPCLRLIQPLFFFVLASPCPLAILPFLLSTPALTSSTFFHRIPHRNYFFWFLLFLFHNHSTPQFLPSIPSLPSKKISTTNKPNRNHETYKTRTRMLMADRVLAIEELQHQIRVYLTLKDVKACTLVSQQWNRYCTYPPDTKNAKCPLLQMCIQGVFIVLLHSPYLIGPLLC